MNQKIYPKTVMLKKGIINVVVIGVMLILFLILHNLYNASSASKNPKSETTIQSVAGQADINWYKNQKMKTVSFKGKKDASITTETENNFHKNASTQENIENEVPKQDLVKAMSASITSNQLIEEQQTTSSSNIIRPINQSEITKQSDDQNMQIQKNSFIQVHTDEMGNDYLGTILKNPISQFIVQAGTIIPGVLITGINSDLPGEITGQVRSNVYDSISGKYLLIPQGSKLWGLYYSQVAYGQERVLVVWKRIIFPNGQSINLQGMPGVDMSGYSGFNDQVNNHYGKIFGSVILMSVLSAGAQLSQPQNSDNAWQAPTVGQTIAQSLGTNIANTGTMITNKNINIQPTLEIRQGYKFNISVTKDIVFPSAYTDQ
jgi:type IV secretory pathway VirB10-like protein